jgi:hypothetical protein
MPKHLLEGRTAWYGLRIVLAGVATGAAAAALLPIGLPIAVVGGALAYFIGVLVLRAVELADVNYVMNRFKRGRAQP